MLIKFVANLALFINYVWFEEIYLICLDSQNHLHLSGSRIDLI